MEEIIVPSIWEASTFLEKVGDENRRMMWTFTDQGGRDCCLIPEVTGLLQETWRDTWSKQCGARRLFYVARCYRYERPQRGRYREFTQIGFESLGRYAADTQQLLMRCLDAVGLQYDWDPAVKRGMSYYVGDGFEAVVPSLGAQKQVAGGGAYPEGVGWGIGLDRVVLALMDQAGGVGG